MNQVNLKSLSRDELTEWIVSLGEKSFRASQIWTWLYQKNVTDFSEMTNISRQFQETLKESACLYTLQPLDIQGSHATPTQKFLWRLDDGLEIESVYIPENKRRTFCISTQAGCAMGCLFCATAAMGLQRNLEVHEITGQVLAMQRQIGEKPTNIVVMGMGEPFHNYDNVIKALTILNHMDGAALSHRRITISTCGPVPMLERYTREMQPFKLAISLNATAEEQRSRLMPINRKYPLDTLIQAAREYTRISKKRITFEYVLIKDVNDSREDARRLMKLLQGIPCKVNLIAYNPSENATLARPSERRIHEFADIIRPLCAPVTLRLSKGDDIQAACGQLATAKKRL